MPQWQGIKRQQVRLCDRCGFLYPLGELTMQKGLMLDAKCIDNLDVEQRPAVIATILADGEEGSNELEIVTSETDDWLSFNG